MRILVLNPFELTAATTIRMEQLSKVIARKHEILFVSYGKVDGNSKQKRLKRAGIEYLIFAKRFPSPLFHFHQMYLRLLVCMREDYDFMYVSKPLPWALLPALAARAIREKRILLDWDEHEHAIISRISKNSLYLWIMGCIERYGVRKADGLVVVSPYLRKLALKWGYNNEKIALVQNGVDPKEFIIREDSHKLRRRFGISGKIVMFLGSLRPQFDIDLVLKAMALVKRGVSDAKLVIVGEGSEKKRLEELAMRLGIADVSFFIGQQPHELVPSLIGMADAVVAPNRRNEMNLSRSPVKIAEYMAIGTPIIANAVGLAEEMLQKGAGELVYLESPEEMAEKIVKILNNERLAKQLSKTAKERVVRLYTWNKLGGELGRFINSNFSNSN
jgi:glycosyltransferase involved in cell wall biosynthesis